MPAVHSIFMEYNNQIIFDNYNGAIMGAMASEITRRLLFTRPFVCSGPDQRKHQSSASLAFVGEFNGDRWIPTTKGQ